MLLLWIFKDIKSLLSDKKSDRQNNQVFLKDSHGFGEFEKGTPVS